MKNFKDLQAGDKFYVYNRATNVDKISTIARRNKYTLYDSDGKEIVHAGIDRDFKVYVQQRVVWSTFPLTDIQVNEMIRTQSTKITITTMNKFLSKYKELKADFEIIDETSEYVLIEDQYYNTVGLSKTVTNDVENVIKYLWENNDLGNRRLIYVDTENHIDEILHENGIFKGFKPGHDGINLNELFEITYTKKI
jgi:hypothetical protein